MARKEGFDNRARNLREWSNYLSSPKSDLLEDTNCLLPHKCRILEFLGSEFGTSFFAESCLPEGYGEREDLEISKGFVCKIRVAFFLSIPKFPIFGFLSAEVVPRPLVIAPQFTGRVG